MSTNGTLNRAQRAVLIRGLVEMVDKDNYIPHSVETISAKLSEVLGRTVSDMTTRTYLKDAGFTWLRTTGRGVHRPRNNDRVGELARVVRNLMITIGINDTNDMNVLQAIIDKQRLSP